MTSKIHDRSPSLTYLLNLTATYFFLLQHFFNIFVFVYKILVQTYFSNDKSKDSDDKFKTGIMYLSLGNLLNLIFKLCNFLFLKISCLVFSCPNAINNLKQIILKNLGFKMVQSASVDAECSSNNFLKRRR